MQSGVSSLGKIQALALLRRTYRGAAPDQAAAA